MERWQRRLAAGCLLCLPLSAFAESMSLEIGLGHGHASASLDVAGQGNDGGDTWGRFSGSDRITEYRLLWRFHEFGGLRLSTSRLGEYSGSLHSTDSSSPWSTTPGALPMFTEHDGRGRLSYDAVSLAGFIPLRPDWTLQLEWGRAWWDFDTWDTELDGLPTLGFDGRDAMRAVSLRFTPIDRLTLDLRYERVSGLSTSHSLGLAWQLF
jgi:hypothetical protein